MTKRNYFFSGITIACVGMMTALTSLILRLFIENNWLLDEVSDVGFVLMIIGIWIAVFSAFIILLNDNIDE